MMTGYLRFERPALAAEMASSASGRQKWNSDADGLFLAAPRRTGKSTFLKGDLKPALEAMGADVIYLDFWTNLQVDPAELLYAEISRSLLNHAGFVEKMARRAQVSKVQVGAGGTSLEFDPARIGKSAGSSLMAALRELAEVTGRPTALILDEAQQLTVSSRGDDVLKELKAARDTLNQPDDIRLILVMSGSDRDKLGRLTNTKGAAFYGSTVKPLPLLGEDYVGWLSGLLAQSNPKLGSINIDVLYCAFDMLGHRPKVMDHAIGSALNPVTRGELDFEAAVLDHAREIVRAEHAQYLDRFAARSATQRAVLTVLMEMGDAFSPYASTTLRSISTVLGKEVSTASVQTALDALRKVNPPMVWKSNRGEYALDDLGMVGWYQQMQAKDGWPPA
jgi:hypothetical protein